MILYSYHIINPVTNAEIFPEHCEEMSKDEIEQLKVVVKRHFSEGPVRVLSLVGGGIRGYMLGKALEEIEKSTGKRIAQLFDCIVGTSTGVPIAFALAYPEEVSVIDIIKNPELTHPHEAKPKYSAKMVTKIYSHYGPYIFAEPTLKRVLDPFIKGRVDGGYISEKELDELIEQEGEVIKLVAKMFKETPSIEGLYKNIQERFKRTEHLLNDVLGLDVSMFKLIVDRNFKDDLFINPLKNSIKRILEKYLDRDNLNLVLNHISSDIIPCLMNFLTMQSSLPEELRKKIVHEILREADNFYLEPMRKLKDEFAKYERYTETLFDKSGIDEVIKRFLPKNTLVQDFLGCTAGTTTYRDTLNLKVIDSLNPETRMISARKTILAAVSAQTFFTSEEINGENFVDAGTSVKCPSQVGLILASKYFPEDRNIQIFEIGTGRKEHQNIEKPHCLLRILDPGESVGMVMGTGEESTRKSLKLVVDSTNGLDYFQLNFNLAEQHLEKTTVEYFKTMSDSVNQEIPNSRCWRNFVRPLGLQHNLVDINNRQDCREIFYAFLKKQKKLAFLRHKASLIKGERLSSLVETLSSLTTGASFCNLIGERLNFESRAKILSPEAPLCFYNQGNIDAVGITLEQGNKEAAEETAVLSIDGGGVRGVWPLKVLE